MGGGGGVGAGARKGGRGLLLNDSELVNDYSPIDGCVRAGARAGDCLIYT